MVPEPRLDVSSLDQQYLESLQLRNELIKQFNASLQAQIVEVQGRVGPGSNYTAIPTSATVLKSPAPVTESKTAEVNDDAPATAPINDDEDPLNQTGQDDSKVADEVPEKKRFRVVVNKWNSSSQKWEDLEDKPTQNSGVNDRHIIYRRLMDSEDERKCYDEECDIPLPGLKSLLQDTMTHVERESFETESIGFDSPFTNMVYNWDKLEEANQPQQTDDEEL